ncbi:MAG TPA: hypothetical protein VLT88_15895 [Desulfosarcina sp.]|nr:hypothetical protein [Desulfosarcina sp.]
MPLVAGDDFHNLLEQLAGHLPDFLWILPVDEIPVAADVGKQNADMFAFALERLISIRIAYEGVAALIAESAVRQAEAVAATAAHRGRKSGAALTAVRCVVAGVASALRADGQWRAFHGTRVSSENGQQLPDKPEQVKSQVVASAHRRIGAYLGE